MCVCVASCFIAIQSLVDQTRDHLVQHYEYREKRCGECSALSDAVCWRDSIVQAWLT